MITYGELANEASVRYPNSLSEQERLRFVWLALMEIGPEAAVSATADFPADELGRIFDPDGDILPSNVLKVTVDRNGGAEREYLRASGGSRTWEPDGTGGMKMRPVPEAGSSVRIVYKPLFAQPNAGSDITVMQGCWRIAAALKTAELIAKSGNAPDAAMANNLNADYRGELARVRHRLEAAKPRGGVSSRDWQWRLI